VFTLDSKGLDWILHIGESWNLQRPAEELLSPNSFRITTCTEAGCLKIQWDFCLQGYSSGCLLLYNMFALMLWLWGSVAMRLLKRTCKPQHAFLNLDTALAGCGHLSMMLHWMHEGLASQCQNQPFEAGMDTATFTTRQGWTWEEKLVWCWLCEPYWFYITNRHNRLLSVDFIGGLHGHQ